MPRFFQYSLCRHTGRGTDQGVKCNADSLRDSVGRLEANAMNIQSQSVGVFTDLGDGVVTIGLVDPDCPADANTMGLEEDHDLPDSLLLSPGTCDLVDSLGAYAG